MVSAELDAVRPLAEAAALATLTFSPRAIAGSGPMLRFSLTKEDQAEVLARHLVQERTLLRWAIFHPADGYGSEMATLFRRAVQQRGGEVAAEVAYTAGKQDLQEEARRLQARLGGSDTQPPVVDGIFIPDTAEHVAVVVPYLPFVDIRNVVLA